MFSGFEVRRIPGQGAEIHLVCGGEGPPLLLLHGYPQTHAMWHKVAPRLADEFTVVCPDLRGYGDSAKPDSRSDHSTYSKRAMAADLVEVMHTMGLDRFYVAGHDRGARVGHRMALDYPHQILKLSVLDIIPTRHVFQNINQLSAAAYYHWFFLIQPDGLPEHLIGRDPAYFLGEKLRRWGRTPGAFTPEALAEYRRCFHNPEVIRASCEDYRAAASIDLDHDEVDAGQKLRCPVQALWGRRGLIAELYDVIEVWREYAERVQGHAIDCGHFLPEEAPEETYSALRKFLLDLG